MMATNCCVARVDKGAVAHATIRKEDASIISSCGLAIDWAHAIVHATRLRASSMIIDDMGASVGAHQPGDFSVIIQARLRISS